MIITNEILSERKQFLLNRNYATKTIQNYFSDMRIFLNYIRLQNKVSTVESGEITMKEIENRTTYLKEIPTPKTSIYYTIQPTISPATIQWKRIAIKSFLKFLNLIYEEWLDYWKIETKKVKTNFIECLTEDEFKQLFNFIWTYEKYKINALRMQLLVNIWYTSWLRLSEMLGLTIEDVKQKEKRIVGKGNKARRVFFTNSTLDILENYLVERWKPIPRTGQKERESDYVFISHNNWYDLWTPIKKNVVCDKMKKYSEELDIGKRITVHCLRHSYATRLLESWMNIREIQELLGHSDIQTTETYCHVLKSNLKTKVSQIFY